MGITVLIFWALALACWGYGWWVGSTSGHGEMHRFIFPLLGGALLAVIALILSVIWLFQ